MAKNRNLHKAKRAKNDEFYTQLTDIEKEHGKDRLTLLTIPRFFDFVNKLGASVHISSDYVGMSAMYRKDEDMDEFFDEFRKNIDPFVDAVVEVYAKANREGLAVAKLLGKGELG